MISSKASCFTIYASRARTWSASANQDREMVRQDPQGPACVQVDIREKKKKEHERCDLSLLELHARKYPLTVERRHKM